MVGVRHGQCIALQELPGIVVLDVDNHGRLMGVELIGYREVFERLAAEA